MNNQELTRPISVNREGITTSEAHITIENKGEKQFRVMRMSRSEKGIMEIEFRDSATQFSFGRRG